MCGIAGYFGKSKKPDEIVLRTLQSLKHRGPDSCDYFQNLGQKNNLYLLHTRLNIIDIDDRSNQPFHLGPFVLIFNGEIYNYLEIRNLLIEKGIKFHTSGDTEVLANALLVWGLDALDKLEGMWAFAVYNKTTEELILCRDRFGEKPLYFTKQKDGIYFSSETNSLFTLLGCRPRINSNQVHRFLINGYKSIYKGRETFYEEVEEVPSGTWIKISKSGEIETRSFWVPKTKVDSSLTYADSVDLVKESLSRSVSLRLRSDVPVAFCMSGGIDSNALIGMAAKEKSADVHGFTIVNTDERYGEIDLVESAVKELNIKHTAVPLEKKNFLEELTNLIHAHDCPVYTITYFLHWKLMSAIHEAGYKVSISGTGADELLTGYYDHGNLFLHSISQSGFSFQEALEGWQKNHAPFVRNKFLSDPYLYINNPEFRDHIYDESEIFSQFLNRDWREDYYEKDFNLGLLRNRMMNELFHEIVPVILHEDDLNAMYYSIENRSPFLDRQLFEDAFSIPEHFLIKDGMKKSILRDAVRGIVPDIILDNPKKVGFNGPIEHLLDISDKDVQERILDDSPVFDLINRKKLLSLLSKSDVSNSESKFIFNFLNIKILLEHSGNRSLPVEMT